MSSVFISWGSPDKVVADELARRLRATGLDPFFSDVDMHTGDNPNQRVPEVIRNARVAVVALSNESVVRDWVRDEVAMCMDRIGDSKSPLQKLLPVVVGELDRKKIPRPIRDAHLHLFDLTQSVDREMDFERIVGEIAEALHWTSGRSTGDRRVDSAGAAHFVRELQISLKRAVCRQRSAARRTRVE